MKVFTVLLAAVVAVWVWLSATQESWQRDRIEGL